MTYSRSRVLALPAGGGARTTLSVVGSLLAGALLVVSAASAGATSESGTRAGIDSLEASIASTASSIHQLTGQYEQITAEAAALSQQVAQQETALRQLLAQAAAGRALLTQAVLQTYTSPATMAILPDPGVNALVGSEYLTVAAGDVDDQLDAYVVQERRVAATAAAIRGDKAELRAEAGQAANARQEALTEAVNEQGQLGQLEDQLAADIADTGKAPATQGAPVNGGLVDVVQSQTSPSAVPPSTTAPPSAPPTTAPPAATAPTATPPTTAPPAAAAPLGGVWLELRECESGGNYQENTGNGFYGAYQFSWQTWTDLGYPGRPDLEPPAMQDAAAQKLQAEAGWGQWPECSAELGLT